MLALLDAQGTRGVFEVRERLEELREAVARKLREHKVLREFPLEDDTEPLLVFNR
ncbi:MAG: hypothetical protein ACRD3V_00620 [Vicinamibacteria bacterium]